MGRKLVVFLAAALAAGAGECGVYPAKKGAWVKKAAVGKAERGFLPAQGFVFVSGGVVSGARRAVCDLKEGSVSYGVGAAGQPAFGPMAEAAERRLTLLEKAAVAALARDVAASTKTFLSAGGPSADMAVRLLLADGDSVRDLDARGRPDGELKKLYAFVWELVEQGRPAAALAAEKAQAASKRYAGWLEKKTPFAVSVSREDEHASGSGGRWKVRFSPQAADQDVDCRVDLSPRTAECREHVE